MHLLAEGRGRVLGQRVTPGQAADTRELVALVEFPPLMEPRSLGPCICGWWSGHHGYATAHIC